MINNNEKDTAPADKQQSEETPESLQEKFSLLLPEEKEVRCVTLMGDVTEEKAYDMIMALLLLSELSGKEAPYDPIKVYISTYGGSADEMFGIYDMMRFLQSEDFEINTVGIGKVMSAGVLLLAAGTKGNRRIGKHTRVMIHQVSSGHAGTVSSMENEVAEIKNLQEVYITCLAAETDMTKRHIKKLFNRKEDVYISAEQAVEYGIADEVF